MPKYYSGINFFTVKEGDREMRVIIPGTGDKSYDEYLEQAEREKTRDQLQKLPPKPVRKTSKKEVGEALKEYREFLRRRREDVNPKYF